MAREEMFSVNLARRLEKLPTPGLDYLAKSHTFLIISKIIFESFQMVILKPVVNITA